MTHTEDEVSQMSLEDVVAKMNELEKNLDLYKSLYSIASDSNAKLTAKVDAIAAIMKL